MDIAKSEYTREVSTVFVHHFLASLPTLDFTKIKCNYPKKFRFVGKNFIKGVKSKKEVMDSLSIGDQRSQLLDSV